MCVQAYGAGVMGKIKKDIDCWWAGSVTLPEVAMLPRENRWKARQGERREMRGVG